jgi:hypothetical protein
MGHFPVGALYLMVDIVSSYLQSAKHAYVFVEAQASHEAFRHYLAVLG